MKQKIYLIDGNSFIYRMFFALPEFSTKDGKIVNATFGMAKFFVNQLKKENPDYLIFIKDARGDNFRHKIYSEYKATRDKMPDNLSVQIKDIEKMINLMGIDIIEISGYEADDVIGTLATKFSGNNAYEVDILTGDKDLYSLVSENTKIYDTQKKKKFGPEETREKFGIDSNFIIDYLSIVGDSSDNIPGVAGFGPKKAVDLINTIGGIEKVYEIVGKIENGELKIEDLDSSVHYCFKGKTFEKLVQEKDLAFLSKRLATLEKNVDLGNFDLESYKFKPDNILNKDVVKLFETLEFYSLIGGQNKDLKTWNDLGLKVKIIGDKKGLDNLWKDISSYGKVVLDTETTSLNVQTARLVGVSIYLDDKNIYYINAMHKGPQVGYDDLNNFLKNLLSSDKTIIGHNLKYDLEILDYYQKKPNSKIEDESNGQISLGI